MKIHQNVLTFTAFKYGKRQQGKVSLVNADEYSSLCLALMNTCTTYKHAIVILRNVTLAIFSARFILLTPMLKTLMV